MRLVAAAVDWQRGAAGVVRSVDSHPQIVADVPPPEEIHNIIIQI